MGTFVKAKENSKIRLWSGEELIKNLESGEIEIVQLNTLNDSGSSFLVEFIDEDGVKKQDQEITQQIKNITITNTCLDLYSELERVRRDPNNDYQYAPVIKAFMDEIRNVMNTYACEHAGCSNSIL